MTRIGFIYFDSIHIIHHFIGVAAALHKNPNIEVAIITYDGKHQYLNFLLKLLGISKNIVKQVPTYKYRKIIESIRQRNHPSSKYLFKKHEYSLLQYDILVFNDISHEYLHNKRIGQKPKFVLLMHGAGDGEYMIEKSFKKSISKFDLISTSGQKVTDFFKKMGNMPNTKLEVCGYQKFDLVKIENETIRDFFPNKKPIVLYNPHFKENLSSWHKYGRKILDFFYNNETYNLIFAPHINLLENKKPKKDNKIDEKFFTKDNILIDLGSVQSVNMSYTLASDVYLGDVSSQVYEFLLKPRPCLFINAHSVDWQNNKHYQNWKLGQVIPNIDNLNSLLQSRNNWQQNFFQKQKEAIAYTFHESKKSSATERVVKAIEKLC